MENWENSTITESSTREKKKMHTANSKDPFIRDIFTLTTADFMKKVP